MATLTCSLYARFALSLSHLNYHGRLIEKAANNQVMPIYKPITQNTNNKLVYCNFGSQLRCEQNRVIKCNPVKLNIVRV